MLDYKEDTLSSFEIISTNSKNGLSVCDVKYESLFKEEVSACLFIPDNQFPLPAVIFIQPSSGIRKAFYDEAQILAKKGYITLLIEAKFLQGFGQSDPLEKNEFTKTIEGWADIQKYIQTVMEIRKGVTLLSKHPMVDEKRIAFIGHGFGAAWGAILSGIDHRIKAFILISGYGKASEWNMKSEHPHAAFIRSILSPERFEFYISSLRKLDAIHYIKNAAPASLLFQFAENDENIDTGQALSFYTSASFPKKILWYETDHLFTNCEAASIDRHQWLDHQLAAQNGTLSKESTKN